MIFLLLLVTTILSQTSPVSSLPTGLAPPASSQTIPAAQTTSAQILSATSVITSQIDSKTTNAPLQSTPFSPPLGSSQPPSNSVLFPVATNSPAQYSSGSGVQLGSAGMYGIIIGSCTIVIAAIGYIMLKLKGRSKNKESLIELQQSSIAKPPSSSAPSNSVIGNVSQRTVFDPTTGEYYQNGNQNQNQDYVKLKNTQQRNGNYNKHLQQTNETRNQYSVVQKPHLDNNREIQRQGPELNQYTRTDQRQDSRGNLSSQDWNDSQLQYAQDVLRGRAKSSTYIADRSDLGAQSRLQQSRDTGYSQAELNAWHANNGIYGSHGNMQYQGQYVDGSQYVDENGQPYTRQEVEEWNRQQEFAISEARSNGSISRDAYYPSRSRAQSFTSSIGHYSDQHSANISLPNLAMENQARNVSKSNISSSKSYSRPHDN